MGIDYVAVGERIRRIRKEQKMSQEKLAELIDVSTPHMSNIENGKTKFSLQVLIDLANSLNTTPDALLLDQIKGQDKARCMVIEDWPRAVRLFCSADFIDWRIRSNYKKILKQYERKLNKKE